jgi:ABC-type polysaccharide/polyol phosphate export permease
MPLTVLRECVKKRELLKQIVVSKLSASQTDLVLGYIWWFLEPLLLTLVYWLLVSVIFQRGGPNYPLFVLCGIIPYRAFAQSFAQSVSALSSQFSLLGLIRFPRIFLPVSGVLVNHVKLFFGFIVILAFSLIYGVHPTVNLVFLFIPFLLQILLLCGLALIFSVLGVYLRDLNNLMQFITRILLYLSPVLYSLDRIPEKYHLAYLLNPIASLILMYRDIIIQGIFPDLTMLFIVLAESILLFLFGVYFFNRHEKNILKFI